MKCDDLGLDELRLDGEPVLLGGVNGLVDGLPDLFDFLFSATDLILITLYLFLKVR